MSPADTAKMHRMAAGGPILVRGCSICLLLPVDTPCHACICCVRSCIVLAMHDCGYGEFSHQLMLSLPNLALHVPASRGISALRSLESCSNQSIHTPVMPSTISSRFPHASHFESKRWLIGHAPRHNSHAHHDAEREDSEMLNRIRTHTDKPYIIRC